MLLAAATASAQSRDWIFLVDNSRAMRDLLPDVKASIAAIPDAADSATTMTFQRGHIGDALAKALDAASRAPRRACAIVLYTNAREDATASTLMMSLTQRVQELRPSIFFVSLGAGEPQFDVFADQTDRTQVLRPDAIRDATLAIRKAVKPPQISVSPRSISFGSLAAGEDSDERDITISSDKRVMLTVALANASGVTMVRRDNIVITETAPAHLSLKVSVTKDADAGARELQVLVGEQILPARVVIKAPSFLAHYGIALAIIGLISAGCAAVRIRRRAVRSTTLRA